MWPFSGHQALKGYTNKTSIICFIKEGTWIFNWLMIWDKLSAVKPQQKWMFPRKTTKVRDCSTNDCLEITALKLKEACYP